MAEPAQLQVRICYATPQLQVLRELKVPAGATVQQAIMQSGLLREHAAIDLTNCRVGIYGKLKELDTPVRDQDRIEIYRPLIADPMESRRRRVTHKDKAALKPGQQGA
jgi:putative ubiquitin-RnfH superfamily antitoxin RatB of RatAB toxin-antitoxin module